MAVANVLAILSNLDTIKETNMIKSYFICFNKLCSEYRSDTMNDYLQLCCFCMLTTHPISLHRMIEQMPIVKQWLYPYLIATPVL